MNNITLEKLEALCSPHGVTIEAHVDSWGWWNVVFLRLPNVLGIITSSFCCVEWLIAWDY